MKVLLVDDEVDLLYEVKIFLERNNHDVLTAETGESGLETYFLKLDKESNSPPFDIVILDYQLPGENGMKVAEKILSECPTQRILFASAYVEDTLKDSIKTLKQIVELLQKPFSLHTLLKIIEDTNMYKELEILNVDIKNLKILEPTHAQISTYLDILKKIQNN
ncbi:MAG: response regulator [Thaumarchaeota archaeon]|nr:response regulator [Nitrososphaerota archaeon]